MNVDLNFKKIIDILPLGAYWLDKNDSYLGCNKYYADFFGIDSTEKLIGKNIADFIDSNNVKIIDCKKNMINLTGIFIFERAYVFSDKNKIHFSVYQIPYCLNQENKDNQIRFFIEHDITCYKNENNRLRNKIKTTINEKNLADVYLQNIIQILPGSVYWKDDAGVILGDNLFHARIAGFKSIAEVIGKTDYDLIWHEQADAIIKNDRLVMETNEPIQFEEIALLSDNTKHTFLTSKAPLRNKDNKVIGIIGISIDISDRKKAEEELRHTLNKLELANRTKSEFLVNMSHDIKTPLVGIISFSELLNLQVPAHLHETTKNLLASGKSLMSFLDDCIELCKIENYSITLSKERFSLKQLLKEIVELLTPAIKNKKLFLYIDYSDEIPAFLLGSRVALYRILLNLLGNAVKFTKEGSISIKVELGRNSTDEKTIIKLTVIDTGIGIPDDKKSLVFEKFYRFTPSYQGTYEGHGIGLYIVKELVEAMHGEVHLESEEGNGSEFIIIVPLQKSLLTDSEFSGHGDKIDLNILQYQPEIKNSEKVSGSLEIKKSISSNTKATILVVEDNEMASIAIMGILSTIGCHVDLANNGQNAITLFEAGKYDLIFMDIGLPDMKGYEVSKRLREVEKITSFNVPILGLSAHASQEDKKLSSEAGISEMLTKPLLLDQAKAILERYNLKMDTRLCE